MKKLDAWRRHSRSAAWSTLEYAAYPLLMLAATPFFVAWLGREGYGHWMTVLAVVGLGNMANAGMAAATINFVAARRARGDAAGAALVARQSGTLAACAGGVLAVAVAAAAAPLARLLGSEEGLVDALRLGAALLVLTQADLVFAAALKGCERFALAARVEVCARCAMVAASLGAAYATREAAGVVAAAVGVGAASAAARALAASRALGRPVYLPAAFWRMGHEVWRYAAWNWLQGAAASAFAHLDRVLIAALLGASAVTSYSVCTQLAAQIHALPAAALAFLLPMMSRRSAAASAGNEAVIRAAIVAGGTASVVLSAALFVFGDAFMRVWMGDGFAAELGTLLPWLTAAYLLLGLGVAPHYLLLGRGEARFVSLNNVAGGVAASLGAALLIPLLGLTGGAVARALYAPLIMASYLRLLQGQRSS